jgi:hypothetical protein
MSDEYIPFGADWQKEVKKFSKDLLIVMLADALKEKNNSFLIKGKKVLELKSMQDWVNNVPGKLPYDYQDLDLIFRDKRGYVLKTGFDFEFAEYPVEVYSSELTRNNRFVPEELVEVRMCRECGCTDFDCSQCIEKDGFPCYWVEENLCSSCQKTEKNGHIEKEVSDGD